MAHHRWTRRELISAGGRLAGGLLAATAVSVSGQKAFAQKSSGKVLVRALGGAYEDAERRAIYEPFTKATGIDVVPVPTTMSQVLAMVRSGSVQLDVLDLGESGTILLDHAKALAPIDYGKFTLTNPSDLTAAIRRPNMVGNIYFATVLGYSTTHFSHGHPASWAEFWDTGRFPGPRSLEGIDAGDVPLEFALLADGVPMSKLYPIDVDRAFRSLGRIRKSIVKWWTTGAESAELLESGQVVAMDIWNGRIQDPIDKGAPLAIEWNQAMRLKQFWSIVRGAPNAGNALRFIDFALQPHVQADLAHYIPYGPTNKKAFQFISAADADKLASSPQHFRISFDQDAYWWADHLDQVTTRWQTWLLRG
jgi:putative spermidine/putrescine transport system substrate-binding protein